MSKGCPVLVNNHIEERNVSSTDEEECMTGTYQALGLIRHT
jgi:hypothetical protein